jgi:F-type H+-transporting ATPase subunit b
MHSVSVFVDGAGDVSVLALSGEHHVAGQLAAQTTETTEPGEGPSPIKPENKELLWSLGAFLVLLIAMRLWLVPKLKDGMQRRYGKVRGDLEHAEEVRDAARQEVSQYETQLAAVRAEAAGRIEAARHVLDGERTDRFTEANAAIAERRSAAAADAEAAMLAAQSSVEEAAAGVASRVVELSTGRRPDGAVVRSTVGELMTGAARS